MTVTYRELTTEEQALGGPAPTHFRVYSVTLRLDSDEPAITGFVEVGTITEHIDSENVTHQIFAPSGQVSCTLTNTVANTLVSETTRQSIRDALIQNVKDSGTLTNIL